MTLYDYFRSSAAYRVRIALALKNIEYDAIDIDLLQGAQKTDAYHEVNPQRTVPYLIDGTTEISQSLAIIDYLDETHPAPPLLPAAPADKAYVRQLALLVACDIHGFSQPIVWKTYLPEKLGATEAQGKEWREHWITRGLRAYEELLVKFGKHGSCSFGDTPTLADLCLIPQLYGARRFGIDLNPYPAIRAIEKHCIALPSFRKAAPENHRAAPPDIEHIHGTKSPLLAA